MNQANNRIREEWEKVYLKSEKDSLGGNLPYKVISSEESSDWWLSKIDELLKTQREDLVEKIREFKCEVPPTPNNLGKIYTEEMVNKVIKYVGRFNYNKALDDLLSNLSTNKENKNNG